MKKIVIIVLLSSILEIFTGNVMRSQDYADANIVKLVKDSVYEVVLLKGTNDTFQYDQDLPMDQVPFQIRNDKYIPVGTAFAISNNRFITASHVVEFEKVTSYSNIFVRDQDGNVYEMDKIYRYSNSRDFVIFSVKNSKTGAYLNINQDSESNINQDVYAVGNALGEGIVIRNGLLTSTTPESRNGEWNWLRFSAAASPGNSGGPLINKNGEVIGIVLAKTMNENLNYALPISEINKVQDNQAQYYCQYQYDVMNTDLNKTSSTDFTYILPADYLVLRGKISGDVHAFVSNLFESTKKEYSNRIFPYGDGSRNILNQYYYNGFLTFIIKGNDGNWGPLGLPRPETMMLSNNSYIQYTRFGDKLIAKITKNDDIDLESMLTNSSEFMKIILQGIKYNRPVGNARIGITSMGRADEDYMYKDNYGRKWVVRLWSFPYNDYQLITYTLPTPDGAYVILESGLRDRVNYDYRNDMNYLLDFVSAQYYGDFKEWDDFLNLKGFIPDNFNNFSFVYKAGSFVTVKSPRFSLSYDTNLYNIDDNSGMILNYNYFRSGGRVVWDISSLSMIENKNNKNSITFIRQFQPEQGLNDGLYKNWYNLTNGIYPYNEELIMNSGMTLITSPGLVDLTGKLAYTITLIEEDNVAAAKLKNKLDMVKNDLKVLETANASILKVNNPQTGIITDQTDNAAGGQ